MLEEKALQAIAQLMEKQKQEIMSETKGLLSQQKQDIMHDVKTRLDAEVTPKFNPVSYTHLDVYKRQSSSSLPGALSWASVRTSAQPWTPEGWPSWRAF